VVVFHPFEGWVPFHVGRIHAEIYNNELELPKMKMKPFPQRHVGCAVGVVGCHERRIFFIFTPMLAFGSLIDFILKNHRSIEGIQCIAPFLLK